jgi:hypothetical protein
VHHPLAVGALALLSASALVGACGQGKDTGMNVQPVRVRATCRDADCRFTGQDMFLDIGVINDHAAEIGFPLRYVQKKGPIIRLIDARTRKETYLRTNPADEDLMEELTPIAPGQSVVIEWVIKSSELQQFGGRYVDLLAEVTLVASVKVGGDRADIRAADTLRIVSKDRP